MNADEILEAKRKLVGAMKVTRSMLWTLAVTEGDDSVREELRDPDRHVLTTMVDYARTCAPYGMTADCVSVIDETAAQMPRYPLAPSDLPTDRGFVFFERPIVREFDPHEFHVSGIGWERRLDRTHLEGEADGISIFVMSLTPNGPVVAPEGHWGFGSTCDVPELPGGDQTREQEWDTFRLGLACEFLAALFRFLAQRVSVVSRERAGRTASRRAAKAEIDSNGVLVVKLRRAENPTPVDDAPGSVEWSCRWIVRGFWRQQWYPSEQRHAPVFIAPYVKGPADRPLVVKDRVFSVER